MKGGPPSPPRAKMKEPSQFLDKVHSGSIRFWEQYSEIIDSYGPLWELF